MINIQGAIIFNDRTSSLTLYHLSEFDASLLFLLSIRLILFYYNNETDENNLSGEIPSELSLLPNLKPLIVYVKLFDIVVLLRMNDLF